jgi:hypothetical protein
VENLKINHFQKTNPYETFLSKANPWKKNPHRNNHLEHHLEIEEFHLELESSSEKELELLIAQHLENKSQYKGCRVCYILTFIVGSIPIDKRRNPLI